MKIGILTSSRADYGIYSHLLEKLAADNYFQLEIIAFGTHLSTFHGYTINAIRKDNIPRIHEISTILTNDNANSIATSYGLTALKFADFWSQNQFDLVLCLGDRFEMNAAVQAGLPFGVKFGHLHGGETTLGAIDNVYRHQITIASKIHFTAAEDFSRKVKMITGEEHNIFTSGSISLEGIEQYVPPLKKEFLSKFNIRNRPYVLVTFHPETVDVDRNAYYAEEMRLALEKILGHYDLVITMPNADTLGSVYRDEILKLKSDNGEGVTLIENFGKYYYFAAMHYSEFLIGNTSSGIIEAASFNKYVINVGDRQKGRLQSDNILNVPFDSDKVVEAMSSVAKKGNYNGVNCYYRPNSTDYIIKKIKAFHEEF